MDWILKKANEDTERYHLNKILQDIRSTIDEVSTGGVLPVVTGEVPPVLVYFDDGSLLYSGVL